MIIPVGYCIGFVEAVVGWGALAGERKCRLPAGSGSVNTHTHTHNPSTHLSNLYLMTTVKCNFVL